MKSQFKQADASGARFALVFGADELAQGVVAVKPLRDAAARPGARGRWPTPPPGRPTCSTHNPHPFACTAAAPWPHNSTCKNRNNSTRSRRSGSKYGNLITWALVLVLGGLRGLERLATGTSATRPSRPARCSTNSTAPRRPATPSAPAASSPT